MVKIIEVDFYLVRPNDIVVVPFWVRLLCKQLFLVAVFDAGRTSDAGAELQNASVVALKLVGIAWNIRTRPHKTHLSDKDINQFSKTIHLTVAQPMPYAGDARVTSHSDGVAFRLVGHCAELADTERLAVFSNAPLHEKQRPFGVELDEDGDDKQRHKKHDKAYKRHDAVEAPLEEESYFVFIFFHAAWPPC